MSRVAFKTCIRIIISRRFKITLDSFSKNPKQATYMQNNFNIGSLLIWESFDKILFPYRKVFFLYLMKRKHIKYVFYRQIPLSDRSHMDQDPSSNPSKTILSPWTAFKVTNLVDIMYGSFTQYTVIDALL